VAATENVRQLSSSDNSLTPRHGVLTLFGYGIQVRVDRGHLLIEDGIGEDRRKIRLARVSHGLKRLVCIGADGFISLAALQWLAAQDASFVMLERDGSVLATTGPVRPSDAKLRRAQALAHLSGAALRITRELIRQKLAGQALVARCKLLDTSAADTIARFSHDLPKAKDNASIRLIEAQAASAYWSAWRTLPITFPKSEHSRIPAHWMSFGARISPLTGSPRLSVNPPNAMLNYLYAVLESEARLAASAMGLDPGLGVLHVDSKNRDSLALDLLEPIRPQVDSYLLDWITRQPLRREWFFEQQNGNCRLMGPFAIYLSETAVMWRRAVAPVAEWVAQAMWDSVEKRRVVKRALPTRLTQRRRTEIRGKEVTVRMVPAPLQPKVCVECGAATKRGRHCLKCGKAISGKKLIELAKVGRIMTLGSVAQRKRSETQRRHEAAKRDWRNSSDADSFSPEAYEKEIQPRLASVTIATIASTLGVSAPYAANIRSGRRRPHPRNWQALAKLVEVST
jgi:CRISPR-associated endonuclease Cas1